MTKRILSIDGGGIRGLIPAIVLTELERIAGKPCFQLFDLLAGNSTGGIIAVGLLAGLPAQQLADLYGQRGHEIFADPGLTDGALGPKYDPGPLEQILQDLLGQTWLSETKGPEFLACSYCSDPVGAWFFKSWKARGTNLNPGDVQDDLDFRLWQVARATSAAETYFPTAQATAMSGKTYWFDDGGTHCNNPAAAALASAVRLWGKDETYEMLSLGTGAKAEPLDGPASAKYGALEWVTKGKIVDRCMDGSAEVMAYIAESLGAPLGSVTRLQPTLTAATAAMDDASPANLVRLTVVAQALLNASPGALDRFAGAPAG